MNLPIFAAQFRTMNLAAVGSVAFDAIETPFGKTDKIVGGAGTYIALASSFFVTKQSLISVVGGDFPKEFLDLLAAKGVDTSGVEIKHNEKTFFWSGRYHTDMNSRDTLVTELNVLGEFQPIQKTGKEAVLTSNLIGFYCHLLDCLDRHLQDLSNIDHFYPLKQKI